MQLPELTSRELCNFIATHPEKLEGDAYGYHPKFVLLGRYLFVDHWRTSGACGIYLLPKDVPVLPAHSGREASNSGSRADALPRPETGEKVQLFDTNRWITRAPEGPKREAFRLLAEESGRITAEADTEDYEGRLQRLKDAAILTQQFITVFELGGTVELNGRPLHIRAELSDGGDVLVLAEEDGTAIHPDDYGACLISWPQRLEGVKWEGFTPEEEDSPVFQQEWGSRPFPPSGTRPPRDS